MVAMERQPLSHQLIQRFNQHASLSNHHNIRIGSPPRNGLNHILHNDVNLPRSQGTNDVKGHRAFNNMSRSDHAVDDQMSCSPLSLNGDDQMNQSSILGLDKDHTAPVVGRKRRKNSGPQVRPTCNECGKDFSNQSALSKHKLTHSDVRKFSCEVCEKAFKRQDHLNGHMLTHREKKPYECDVEGCEKTYCDARSLRRHKENHHSSISVVTGSHSTVADSNNVASSALRSLLSGHAGNLFPHQNMIASDLNPFTQGYLADGHSSNTGNQIAPNRSSHPLDIPTNQVFSHGYNYPLVVNDEMPSPHPPPFQIRRTAPIHPPPPPIVLNQSSSYDSHSVPTTPTTIHPQTPVSAEPLPSPHHLSVNNHYGSMNGHQHSHPCTPTQPVNTFSFSPHQVQQYHQQQQEQNQNGARSLPTTPTEHQNSPSTPVVGYVNEGHHYQQVYQHSDVHHGPRSLPATPADHQGMPYSMHHQSHTYNDPNPSPYSVASQSSPYDLHQPASHLQNQQQPPQSNNSNYQNHHEPRQQLHSTGTYEEHDMSETAYQESTTQADIDDFDVSQIDVQNLMEHIQSHQSSSGGGQPSMESQQSFYPQTEPITPTTPATPTSFHSFPIPNKFQAHNFRSNVIHQSNQDTLIRAQAFPHPISSGKSMSLIMNTQQQHVDHNHQQQQMLQVESVNHRQDVTNPQHHNPDANAFQVPSLVNRNFSSRSAMDLKQNSTVVSMPAVQNPTGNQHFGSAPQTTGFRDELRSSTPPNLVVNLSPMTSHPPSTAVSSTITIADDDGHQNHVAENRANNTSVIIEEDEDDVFPPTIADLASDDTLTKVKELIRNEKLMAEYNPNQNEICQSNQVSGVNVKNQSNLKRSHATGGVIVHGTDQNVRQQSIVQGSNMLLQALQKAQQFDKGSNENKKPCENKKVVELQSPKRMRHKPEPIYIPPQVNAFGVSNHFSSRTSRSPRIWDGKGSQISSSVNHGAFTKLSFNQVPLDTMSKISPPPYTPPPMLSPVRTSFGYYYHINLNASGTPKIPLAPSSFGTSVPRKFSLFPVTKDGHSTASKPEIFDNLKDQLEVKTPMTAYEPFPEFATSFDSERSSEGDILPHVNIGPNYQARIPAFIGDKESARDKYRQEKADLVWNPSILENNLHEEDIISFLEVSCSQCVPGSGRNQEYAHHLLYRAKGDLQEALMMLLEPKPKIKESDPLFGYHYSETDIWSTEDICLYHQALVKCDKDFVAISKEVSYLIVPFSYSFSYSFRFKIKLSKSAFNFTIFGKKFVLKNIEN